MPGAQFLPRLLSFAFLSMQPTQFLFPHKKKKKYNNNNKNPEAFEYSNYRYSVAPSPISSDGEMIARWKRTFFFHNAMMCVEVPKEELP